MAADAKYYEVLADGHLRLRIRLTPNARKEAIGGVMEDADGVNWLKASVRPVPEDGKANKALIKLLSKQLGVPKSSLTLASGHTSRNKTFLIAVSDELIGKLKLL